MNVLTLLPLNIGTAVVGISNINFFVLIVLLRFIVHTSCGLLSLRSLLVPSSHINPLTN